MTPQPHLVPVSRACSWDSLGTSQTGPFWSLLAGLLATHLLQILSPPISTGSKMSDHTFSTSPMTPTLHKTLEQN